MLLNLNKNKWTEGLSLQGFDKQEEDNLETVEVIIIIIFFINLF